MVQTHSLLSQLRNVSPNMQTHFTYLKVYSNSSYTVINSWSINVVKILFYDQILFRNLQQSLDILFRYSTKATKRRDENGHHLDSFLESTNKLAFWRFRNRWGRQFQLLLRTSDLLMYRQLHCSADLWVYQWNHWPDWLRTGLNYWSFLVYKRKKRSLFEIGIQVLTFGFQAMMTSPTSSWRPNRGILALRYKILSRVVSEITNYGENIVPYDDGDTSSLHIYEEKWTFSSTLSGSKIHTKKVMNTVSFNN